jgi:hypothetical protein
MDGGVFTGVTAEEAAVPRSAVARQRVYVLCGGDSAERDVSLLSAVTVWLHLRQYHDLEVSLFVLAPQFSSIKERSRRLELLRQRNELLLVGVEEDALPEGLSLDEVRRPYTGAAPPLEQRVVWAVPHALALRRSVEEVVEACELMAMNAGIAEHALPRGAVEGRALREQMTWELTHLGLEDAGSAFEGLGAPRAMATDFEAFAYHAQVSTVRICTILQLVASS